MTVDPVARHAHEHLEYRPLVNARAHALGSRRQIVNGPLHDQYHRVLKTLTYRGRFDYASVNTPERHPVERFAVLVLSDDRGAVIREAAPPQQ